MSEQEEQRVQSELLQGEVSLWEERWGDCEAQVTIAGVGTIEGVATIYCGASLTVDFSLSFEEGHGIHGVRLSFGYQAFGSGSPETHALAIASHDEVPANFTTLEERLVYKVPAEGPMSYEGTYVKIQWSVTIELREGLGMVNERQIPLIVLPRPVDWSPS